MYPLVGRSEDGISKYSKYLAGKVAERGQTHLTAALKMSKDGMFQIVSWLILCTGLDIQVGGGGGGHPDFL